MCEETTFTSEGLWRHKKNLSLCLFVGLNDGGSWSWSWQRAEVVGGGIGWFRRGVTGLRSCSEIKWDTWGKCLIQGNMTFKDRE